MADQGSGFMKRDGFIAFYFILFFILSWMMMLGYLGALQDCGCIDIESWDDYWVFSLIFLPTIAALILTWFKLKRIDKVSEKNQGV